MTILKNLILAAWLAATPCLALAEGHAKSAPPCGWSNGGLADPAETQRCLAARFKPPKPKPAQAQAPSQGQTPANAAIVARPAA